MKKTFFLGFFYIFAFNTLLVAEDSSSAHSKDIAGYWKTIDEKTQKPQSIIAIYEYQGKYYGRIVATYNDDGKFDDTIYEPKTRAPGIKGEPYYSGMDIIWNVKKVGHKYSDGHIVDPEKGRVYGVALWTQGDNLVVRGELFIFGRNQTWLPVHENEFSSVYKKPDTSQFVPVIPQVK